MQIQFIRKEQTLSKIFKQLDKIDKKQDALIDAIEGTVMKKNLHSELSPLENTILNYVSFYIGKCGKSPSQEQISLLLPKSSQTAARIIVVALRDKGYLTFVPNKPRSIKLTDKTF